MAKTHSVGENNNYEHEHSLKSISNGNLELKERNKDWKTCQESVGSTHDSITPTNTGKPRKYSRFLFSWRFGIALMLHSSFLVSTFVRNCMTIAVVCMSTTTGTSDMAWNSTSGFSEENLNNTESGREFSWDSDFQGLVLSSVSFLACFGPFVANAIQPYLGQKMTLSLLTLVSLILTLVIPVLTRVNEWLLVVCRILIGLTFGSNVPVIGDFVARWAASDEKQTMITMAFSGFQTGGILASLLSGFLCTIPVDYGWPFIFYVTGALGLVWVGVWHFLSSSTPENHKYISQEELQYIQQHRLLGKEPDKNGPKERPPFKTILTSRPVLLFFVCSSLHMWTVNLFFTYQAIFLAAVLGFSPSETGSLMSVYSFVRFMGMGFWTALCNRLRSKTALTNTRAKKICIAFGMGLSTVAQGSVIFMDAEHRWVIVGMFFLLMFAQSAGGCILPGLPQDIAPRYAGFVTGLFFSVGSLLSISAPLIVAALTPNNTAEEWNGVWIIMTGIFLIVLITFTVFGDATLQPWAADARADAPEVVSPFDSMQKRFSTVMHAPPMAHLSLEQVPSFTLDVEAPQADGKTMTSSTDSVRELTTTSNGEVNAGFTSTDDVELNPTSNGKALLSPKLNGEVITGSEIDLRQRRILDETSNGLKPSKPSRDSKSSKASAKPEEVVLGVWDKDIVNQTGTNAENTNTSLIIVRF